jgi:hypothetical protein
LVLLLGLLLQPALFLSAGEDLPGPLLSPKSKERSLRDVERTIRARQILNEDEVLAPLNLGVHVRDGIAVVWGPIPSRDQVRRVVARMEKVPGVYVIRTELYVVSPSELFEALLHAREASNPIVTESASPNEVTGTIGTLTAGKPQTVPKQVEVRKNPVTLLAPVGIDENPHRSDPEQGNSPLSVAAVQRVQQSEPRFRDITTEVQGATVYLRGKEGSDEDVMALGQALSRLPGVERVLVQRPRR